MSALKKNKKGFELPFGMIFAIIAGTVILFIAIYSTTKFIQTSQHSLYSESAANLGNLLNPVVNDITIATKSPKVEFKTETRIFLGCEASIPESRIFGKQVISFSEKSGFFGGWGKPGANISRYNKYIFAENMMQGETLYIFSKPLFLGYKVDDMVFLSTDDYCFIGAPEFIRTEMDSLNLKNINLTVRLNACKKDSVKVCFDFVSSECNMTVYPDGESYETGKVMKSGRNLFYVKGLIYGAIFSSPDIYECNIKRLGSKASELAQIYLKKIDIVSLKSCNSQIGDNLNSIISLSANLTSSKLKDMAQEAKLMDNKNCGASCMIYASELC